MMSEYLRMAEQSRDAEERSSWALVSIAESLSALVEACQSTSPRPPKWLVGGVRVKILPGAMYTNSTGESCYTTGSTPRAVFGCVVAAWPDRDGDVTVRGDDGITYDAHWSYLEKEVS